MSARCENQITSFRSEGNIRWSCVHDCGKPAVICYENDAGKPINRCPDCADKNVLEMFTYLLNFSAAIELDTPAAEFISRSFKRIVAALAPKEKQLDRDRARSNAVDALDLARKAVVDAVEDCQQPLPESVVTAFVEYDERRAELDALQEEE